MPVIDSPTLLAVAAVISSVANLISALRGRVKLEAHARDGCDLRGRAASNDGPKCRSDEGRPASLACAGAVMTHDRSARILDCSAAVAAEGGVRSQVAVADDRHMSCDGGDRRKWTSGAPKRSRSLLQRIES